MIYAKRMSASNPAAGIVALSLLSIALPTPASAQQPSPAQSNQQPNIPHAQENAKSESSAQKGDSQLEDGSVTGNIYTNRFFGFTYEFPKGWFEQTDITRYFLKEFGKTRSSAGDEDKNAVADAMHQDGRPLLVVSKHPLGTPDAIIPRITILSADVSLGPGNWTGRDISLAMKPILPRGRRNVTMIREPEDRVFGGKVFSRMDFKFESALGDTVYESDDSTIVGSHVLMFAVIAENPDRLETLVQTLNTLEFKPQPEDSPGRAGGISSEHNRATAVGTGVWILTPTEGVDFKGYITGFLSTMKSKWYTGMPESARKGEKGKVTLLFNIQKDGNVADGPTIELSSGKDVLDQAAFAGVRATSPFDPLPAAFHGSYIRLRIIFLYNLPISAAEQ